MIEYEPHGWKLDTQEARERYRQQYLPSLRRYAAEYTATDAQANALAERVLAKMFNRFMHQPLPQEHDRYLQAQVFLIFEHENRQHASASPSCATSAGVDENRFTFHENVKTPHEWANTQSVRPQPQKQILNPPLPEIQPPRNPSISRTGGARLSTGPSAWPTQADADDPWRYKPQPQKPRRAEQPMQAYVDPFTQSQPTREASSSGKAAVSEPSATDVYGQDAAMEAIWTDVEQNDDAFAPDMDAGESMEFPVQEAAEPDKRQLLMRIAIGVLIVIYIGSLIYLGLKLAVVLKLI